MKRFTVPCDFNGVKQSFHVYIGDPSPDIHPLYYQAQWLTDNRGGTVPQDIMDSFQKLASIAIEHNRVFEDLCVEALGIAQHENHANENTTESATDDESEAPTV